MGAVADYRITAQLIVPEVLPVDSVENLPSPMVEVTNALTPFGVLSLRVASVDRMAKRTVFDVEWRFTASYQPSAQPLDPRGVPLPFLVIPPDANGQNGKTITPSIDLPRMLDPVVVRLAYETESVALLRAFRHGQPADLVPQATVEVASSVIQLVSDRRVTVAFGPVEWRPKPLGEAALTAVLRRKTHWYEFAAVAASGYRAHLDEFAMLLLLATALEVAAYEFLGKLHPRKKGHGPKDFNPSTYLADARLGGGLKRVNRDAYLHCQELWGARHEAVHHGRLAVRQYTERARKDENDQVDPQSLRGFAPGELIDFETAVRSAVEWMMSVSPAKG